MVNEGTTAVVKYAVPLYGASSTVAAFVVRVVTIRTYQWYENVGVVLSSFLRPRRGGLPVMGRPAAFGWPCY